MEIDIHHENIRNQYSRRILTYEAAARWKLNEDLIESQRRIAGQPFGANNLCLDVCCGTGIVGRNLLDLGWKVKGLDLTPEMAWVASQYFPVKIGSVENIPLSASSFDLVVMRQSFMLVDGPRALGEIHRVLKPGGRFLLIQSIPFSSEDDEVHGLVQKARQINLRSYYREADLVSIVSSAGFAIVGQETLCVRESVDHWLENSPELKPELRAHIRDLIANAPASYRRARSVEENGGELFENWNWLFLTGQKS